jgi:hypothetical protein
MSNTVHSGCLVVLPGHHGHAWGLAAHKIAQFLDMPSKMLAKNGCKQKEHVVFK